MQSMLAKVLTCLQPLAHGYSLNLAHVLMCANNVQVGGAVSLLCLLARAHTDAGVCRRLWSVSLLISRAVLTLGSLCLALMVTEC